MINRQLPTMNWPGQTIRPKQARSQVAAAGLFLGAACLCTFLPLRLLFATVITSVAALFLLRFPWLIWIALAAALPIASGLKIGPLSGSDLLLALGCTLWFMDGVRRKNLTLRITWLHVPLALYCFALGISLLSAPNLGEAGVEVIKWVEFGVILTIIPSMLQQRGAWWLLIALLIAAMGQALLGLYQFVNQIGPEWFIILGRFMRASGTFQQPNPYAGYLGLTLPVAASLTIWAWRSWWAEQSPPGRTWFTSLAPATFFTVACAILLAGILASWSRGAWLGTLFALAAVAALHSRLILITLLVATPLFGVILTNNRLLLTRFPQPLVERVQDISAFLGAGDVLNQPLTDENFAIAERLAHWVAALRMWEGSLWFGVGPGNYATLYPEVRLPLWEEPLGHAHNIYLNVLAETGIVGFAAFLLFWGTLFLWVWRIVRHPIPPTTNMYARHREPDSIGQDNKMQIIATPSSRALGIGLVGIFIYLAIHSFFDNLFVQGIYLHIALWLSVLIVSVMTVNLTESHRPAIVRLGK